MKEKKRECYSLKEIHFCWPIKENNIQPFIHSFGDCACVWGVRGRGRSAGFKFAWWRVLVDRKAGRVCLNLLCLGVAKSLSETGDVEAASSVVLPELVGREEEEEEVEEEEKEEDAGVVRREWYGWRCEWKGGERRCRSEWREKTEIMEREGCNWIFFPATYEVWEHSGKRYSGDTVRSPDSERQRTNAVWIIAGASRRY